MLWQRPLRIAAPLLIVLLLIGLAGRALVKIQPLSTAPEILKWQWLHSAVDWRGGGYEPLPRQRFYEQAVFWLQEAERLRSAPSLDPDRWMGAAVALDEILERQARLAQYHGSVASDVDRPVLTEQQVRRSTELCIELAREATLARPADRELWRTRAVLTGDLNGVPRISTWKELFAECAQRDPGNALYDYLAAQYYMTSEGSRELATKAIERAQRQPFLAGGELQASYLHQFQAGTSSRVALEYLQSEWVHPRQVSKRAEVLTHIWHSTLMLEIDNRASYGRACQQWLKGGLLQSCDKSVLFSTEQHLSQASTARVQRLLRQKSRALELALQHDEEAHARIAQKYAVHIWAAWELPGILLALIPLTAATALASRILSRSRLASVKLGPQLILMGLASTISLVWFGWVPARVSIRIQPAIATAIILLISLLLIGGWVWTCWRHKAVQFRLPALLLVTFAVAVLLKVSDMARIQFENFQEFPFELWIAPDHRSGEEWGPFRPVMSWIVAEGSLMSQWSVYRGPLAALMIYVLLLALWYRWRFRHAFRSEGQSLYRRWTAGLLESLARGTLAVGLFCGSTYLWCLPAAMESLDREYRLFSQRTIEPHSYWRTIRDQAYARCPELRQIPPEYESIE